MKKISSTEKERITNSTFVWLESIFRERKKGVENLWTGISFYFAINFDRKTHLSVQTAVFVSYLLWANIWNVFEKTK